VDARVPLARFEHNIGAMVDWARSAGSETLLAPLAQEWDVGRWSVDGLPRPAKDQALPWTPYREALLAISKQRQLVYVPFYSAFAQSQLPPQSLFSDAIHPTPKGAEIMASSLFEALVRQPELLNLPLGHDTVTRP
jgi:hypothetical protein